MKIEAIDLFCGIGGLTYGLQEAKIKVLAGLDNDQTCKYSYEKNNKSEFITADIVEYNFKKMKKMYSEGSFRVLVGCAPCQPFSSNFKTKNKTNDTRWNLINYFLKAIKIINPHVISMENVRGIVGTDIFKQFKKKIENLKYKTNHEIVKCPDYGIPQARSRLVFMASKLGEIKIPIKTHQKNNYVTVEDTIKNLPKIKAGETDRNNFIHKVKALSALNIERIKQSVPGGTWKDWDKALLPNCYRRKSGESWTSVYGRMSWKKVSPTITTQFFNYGSGRFGHPKQNRGLSILEGALLQTFPKNYDFGKDISIVKTSRHIGNAVPPKLAFEIGKTIQKHIKYNYE